ncbi:Potassium channel [Aspergillus nanangensis]|uniref:Potassium channel n=1 Tax=Aspergillus nanangensis TaxID=2582783 RepID=A0AAD4CIH1_ASPNN|nr:Potassium channel [Aspergillus nanangensis]
MTVSNPTSSKVDNDPQDWWFASTAIPLIAATTAPFANVMSIVALVMPWRSTLDFHQTTKDDLPMQILYDDPPWSLALNATSLVCGVAGNIFLLCNFTQAVRYIIALPLSIILWYMAMAVLIAITSAMHIYVPPTFPYQIYTQAYWFAVIAAALYFLLATMLTVNMWGYLLGHYPQSFTLTDSQRTLILQTTALGVWLVVGAAIFQKLIGLNFADALYFSDITILTLGFGDITATTPVARGIIFPYAVIGIIMLGLVVGSLNRSFHEVQYHNVIRKRMEDKRQRILHSLSSAENNDSGVKSNPDIPPEASNPHRRTRDCGRTFVTILSTALCHRLVGKPSVITVKTERDRFNAMRTIQRDTARFHRWYRLTLSLIAFGLVWTCGAAVFSTLEDDLSYFSALYFNFVCLLSVGYGDITPATNAGKSFFVLWSLMAVPTMTTLISEMSDTIIAAFQRLTNLFAKWTILPQHGREYVERRDVPPRSLVSIPPILNFLRVGEGFNPRSLHATSLDEESVRETTPSSVNAPSRFEETSAFDLAHKLAVLIRQVGNDVVKGGREQYNYKEWVEFSQIIRATNPDPDPVVVDGKDEYGVLICDWIGKNSPMLTGQSEPEWVLERLCESQARYMDVLSSKYSRQGNRSSGCKDGCSTTTEESPELSYA